MKISIGFIRLIVVFIVVIHGLTWWGCRPSEPDTSMVVIVSDALRYDVLGCNGGPAKTPNIDRLAANGVVFDRAYAPSPWTLPSAVGMFTGNNASTYPGIYMRGRFIKFLIPPAESLIGMKLREGGFLTHSQVENDMARVSRNFRGFLPFPRVQRGQIERLRETVGFSGRNGYYKKNIGLLNFLLTVPEDRRFFALKWILDPHSPHDPPGIFRNRIPVDRGRLSREVDVYAKSHFGQTPGEGRLTIEDLSEEEFRYVKALYAKEVESVDERVGYVLTAIRKTRRLDRTYIVFTSDHGESFGEHKRLGHGHSYSEELLRVPLIITGPGLPRGKRIREQVSLLGLMPTIMELLGEQSEDDVQGRSFAPLLKGDEWEPEPHFFMGARAASRLKDALLSGEYKLIAHKKKDKFSLFHLPSDPGENRNLAKKEPQVVRRLLAELIRIRKDNGRRLQVNTDRNRLFKKLSGEERAKIIRKLKTLGYID